MTSVVWLGVLLVLLSGPSKQQSNYQNVNYDQALYFLKQITELAKNNQHELSKLDWKKDNDDDDSSLNRYKKQQLLQNLNQQNKLFLEKNRHQYEPQNRLYDVLEQNRPKQLWGQYYFKNQKDLSKYILLDREKKNQQLSQQERYQSYNKERYQPLLDLHRHHQQNLNLQNLQRLLKKALQQSHQEDRYYIPALYFYQSDQKKKLLNIVPKDLKQDLEYNNYAHVPELELEPIDYDQSTEKDQSSKNSQEELHANRFHHSYLPLHPTQEAGQIEDLDSEEDSSQKFQLKNDQETIKDDQSKTPLQLNLQTTEDDKKLFPYEKESKFFERNKLKTAKILSSHRSNRLRKPSVSSRKSVPLEYLLNPSNNADRVSAALYPRISTFSLTEYLKQILPNYSK